MTLDLELLKLEKNSADVTHSYYLSKFCPLHFCHFHSVGVKTELYYFFFLSFHFNRSEICILAAVHISSSGSAERTDKFTPKTYETSLPAEPTYTSRSSSVREHHFGLIWCSNTNCNSLSKCILPQCYKHTSFYSIIDMWSHSWQWWLSLLRLWKWKLRWFTQFQQLMNLCVIW